MHDSSRKPTSNTEARRRVLIFRERLGLESETFIYAQARMLERFTPHILGSRRDGTLQMECDRVHMVNRGSRIGRLTELALKLGRWCPTVDSYLRDVRPELIHAHFGPDATIIGPWAERLRLPLVTTFHGYDATISDDYSGVSRTHRLYRRRRAWLREHGARFIAVSDFIKARLIAQGFPVERIVRHYIGIDLDQFRHDPTVVREPVVLFVGRLVEVKGCELLVEAMTEVRDRVPDARLVVIGEGPLRGRLEALAEQRRVQAEFLGKQPPSVVRFWMSRAAVLSVPSVRARSGQVEAFGIVFAEAAALGLPVATFSSGGIPEAVSDGETGLLAPEGNVRALALAITTLLGNEQLRLRMGAAAVKRVHELFDIRRQTRALEDTYTEAIQEFRVAERLVA